MVDNRRLKREKAREMRMQGLAITTIAITLGVAKSSVSLWVRDVPLTDAQRLHLDQSKGAEARLSWAKKNRRIHQDQRLIYQQQGRDMALQGNLLHQAGCMLYWAEGAKRRNSIYFVNSDVAMMRFFVRFLRECYQITDDEMSVTVTTHETEPEKMRLIEEYWLSQFNLPPEAIRKTQIKKGGTERKNILPYGVCGLRVNRTSVVQQIFGGIQAYAGFERPEWLD